MATRHEIDKIIIEKINDHKDYLSEKFHVESLSVFGSVSRGGGGAGQ